MILRPYQSAASEAIYTEWQTVNSTLAVMATGLGKTVLAADLARRMFPRRTLFLAHRRELIHQAADKITRATGLRCEIEMGELQAAEHSLFSRAPVIVSSIQTQCAGGDGGGRMAKFDPARFGALILDECHHATSSQWQRVINYFRTNPDLKVCGITATPDRADEAALGQIFQTVAFEYEILDGINDGWLVPVQQQMVHVAGLDFSGIRTTAGDLNGGDLAAVMEAEKNMQQVASASVEIIGAKRALAFTQSVRQAEMLSEIFNRNRAGSAAWICGKTPHDKRRQILSDYSHGRIQILCNCGITTEGWDDPANDLQGVQVCIMAKPTKSRSLYTQMAGRVIRPLPNTVDGFDLVADRKLSIASSAKPNCLVVDFVGNSGRHKLMTTADILGGKVSDEAVEHAVAWAKKAGKPVNMTEALDEAEAELQRQREQARLDEAARRARLVASARFTTQSVDPFDVLAIEPVKARGWDTKGNVSAKLRNLLQKHMGLDPDQFTQRQAVVLAREQFRRWDNKLCSFKQAKVLRKYGYPTEVSFADASATIDQLAKNGWHKPAEVAA
jgi:superfamily II DNA or RNA helicase